MLEKILFKRIDIPGIDNINQYIENGGYKALKKALLEMKPDEVIEEVGKSGLRGRGGAGYPTYLKWSHIPKDAPVKYVVCNSKEGEPGTFKDRELMDKDPHQLIEGMIITSYAVGAHHAIINVRKRFAFAIKQLNRALREAYEKGFLGENIMGTGYHLDMVVHRGPNYYICGEETALLESLEGKRCMPRVKPPFSTVAGLYKKPTVVNNTETLANIPHIIENGGGWFAAIGTPKSTGTKIFSVSGDVNIQKNFELPMGTPLRHLIYKCAGGIRNERKLKAVIPGGSSVPVLSASSIDAHLDFESMIEAGSMLGSGGVIVMDETRCIVREITGYTKFYFEESCGKCTPCREGTHWLYQILKRIEEGSGRDDDIPLILDICENMEGKTLCALADGAAAPIVSSINLFKDEYLRHIKEKRCPFRGAA